MLIHKIHRYIRSNSIYLSYFNSKLISFYRSKLLILKAADVSAGLYKVNSLLPEHGMILSSLTGRSSEINYQLHGKRQRRTVSINASVVNKSVWYFLDKFIHEFMTYMYEFSTPKTRKSGQLSNFYTLRIRQKFSDIKEFSDIIENSMYDTHKGIYLPLTIHLKLSYLVSYFLSETYMRMHRIPVSYFRRLRRPAFDDREEIVGMAWLYREFEVMSRYAALSKLVKQK